MTNILTLVAAVLIWIGDLVIFSVTAIFLFGKRVVKKLFLHQKKHTNHVLPVVAKLRYFSFGVLFCLLFVCIPISILALIQSLPNPTQLSENLLPQTTKIYDRHKVLLYQIYANQNRTTIALSTIPLSLRQATIAIEDKNFYKNPGFDIPAIIRASISDISHKNFQGASTITQQLIKSSLLTSEISITRKIQEIILAFWTEKMYTKDQILTMYFNQVPYGGTTYGIETAAQTYFGISASQVDLAQAAFLAGLPQAPTTYSPFGMHPDLWKNRQKEVLQRMHALSFISTQQESDALQEQLHFESPQTPLLAPHFVMYIRNLLEQKYGTPLVEKGGLQVITTLDIHTQDMAQQIVRSEVNQDSNLQISNGAAVIANPKNGDILAMVGSSSYANPTDGNVNIATALRQPGSSIKAVTYATALSLGFTPATILDDSPITYTSYGQSYSPVNYDGRFHGRVSLRIAFANSFNIPAVKTLNSVGLSNFITMGRKMGLRHLQENNQYGLSATLGAVDATMLDMTSVYATIANSGTRVDLNPILEVLDNQGTILEQKPTIPSGVAVLDKGVSFLLSDILSDNAARSQEFGINSPLFIPNYTVSVKTGTSDNKRDNWTIGYTPSIVVATWVGNNDNSPMSQNLASGITGAAPIWHAIMTNLLQGKANERIAQPENVITKECLGRKEYFIKGTENSVNCNYIPVILTSPAPKP